MQWVTAVGLEKRDGEQRTDREQRTEIREQRNQLQGPMDRRVERANYKTWLTRGAQLKMTN